MITPDVWRELSALRVSSVVADPSAPSFRRLSSQLQTRVLAAATAYGVLGYELRFDPRRRRARKRSLVPSAARVRMYLRQTLRARAAERFILSNKEVYDLIRAAKVRPVIAALVSCWRLPRAKLRGPNVLPVELTPDATAVALTWYAWKHRKRAPTLSDAVEYITEVVYGTLCPRASNACRLLLNEAGDVRQRVAERIRPQVAHYATS